MVQPQTVPNGKDPDSTLLRLVSLQGRDQSLATVIIDPWAPGVTLVVFTLRDPNSKTPFQRRGCDCIGTAFSATVGR